MHHVITHTQEAVERGSYTWAFLAIEGASYSTSFHITKAANGTDLETQCRDVLAPCWVAANIVATHRRNTGGVCGQVLSVEEQFIIIQLWSLVDDKFIQGLGNCWYTLRYPHQRKIRKYCLKLLQESLSMEQKWHIKTQLSINPQKVQHPNQYCIYEKTLHILKQPFPQCSSPTSLCSIYSC
jgi:hypothetical protein